MNIVYNSPFYYSFFFGVVFVLFLFCFVSFLGGFFGCRGVFGGFWGVLGELYLTSGAM